MAPATHFELTRALAGHTALIVPGLNNSDGQHWQSLWQAQLPNSARIELDDWATPNLEKWCAAIAQSFKYLKKPAVVIAHSFGALASARIAAKFPHKIAALLLVAPADPDKFAIAQQLPVNKLQAHAKIIASSNDPWMQITKAKDWADIWGAQFVQLNNIGHINSQSALGLWSEGIEHLASLIDAAA